MGYNHEDKLYRYGPNGNIEYNQLSDEMFISAFEDYLNDGVKNNDGSIDIDNEIELYLPYKIFKRLIELARKNL
jgi:hypothetical protein